MQTDNYYYILYILQAAQVGLRLICRHNFKNNRSQLRQE